MKTTTASKIVKAAASVAPVVRSAPPAKTKAAPPAVKSAPPAKTAVVRGAPPAPKSKAATVSAPPAPPARGPGRPSNAEKAASVAAVDPKAAAVLAGYEKQIAALTEKLAAATAKTAPEMSAEIAIANLDAAIADGTIAADDWRAAYVGHELRIADFQANKRGVTLKHADDPAKGSCRWLASLPLATERGGLAALNAGALALWIARRSDGTYEGPSTSVYEDEMDVIYVGPWETPKATRSRKG